MSLSPARSSSLKPLLPLSGLTARRLGGSCAVMLLLLFAAQGCAGCGEDPNNASNLSQGGTGELLTTPAQVAFTRVSVGEEDVRTLTLRNLSSESLTIFEVQFRPGPEGDISAMTLEGLPATPFTLAGMGMQDLRVRYAPTDTTRGRGEIVIASSDPDFTSQSPLVVPVETLANSPELQTSPPAVRFSKRGVGSEAASQTLQITNSGSAPLKILEAPIYVGGRDFSIELPARTYPLTLLPFDAVGLQASPLDYQLELDVKYDPLGSGEDSGDIVIRSNDVSDPDPQRPETGLRNVPVSASSNVPCLLLDSVARNIGQVPVGKLIEETVRLENCGSQPLFIESVRIRENSNQNEYALALGEWDLDGSGDLDQAVEIAPGEQDTFVVEYVAEGEGTDRAVLEVYSNDPVTPVQEVTIVARGAIGDCPIASAVASIKGQSEARPTLSAAPLDYVVLNGSASSDPDGVIPLEQENWIWEVLSAPDDAIVELREADQAPGDPRYREARLLLTGEYEFGLRVIDAQRFDSCNQAVVRVNALSNEKLVVELTWTNPEDPDETDDIGSDVDLHLVKLGPGEWFKSPYDIYFRNANSGPGSENNGIWNPESPSLDIDDVNGLGPETIQLNDPQPCQWYGIGAHYYGQRFGTAFVTVRVYINQKLAFEKINKPLTNGNQFWDVGRVHMGADNQFNQLEVDTVSPGPLSGPPQVTEAMRQSGLCTEANLY